MPKENTISQSLHATILLNSGDFFIKIGKPCTQIGKLTNGVMRGFVYDTDGNEITTHFFSRR